MRDFNFDTFPAGTNWWWQGPSSPGAIRRGTVKPPFPCLAHEEVEEAGGGAQLWQLSRQMSACSDRQENCLVLGGLVLKKDSFLLL